jgi:hypothetical protein
VSLVGGGELRLQTDGALYEVIPPASSQWLFGIAFLFLLLGAIFSLWLAGRIPNYLGGNRKIAPFIVLVVFAILFTYANTLEEDAASGVCRETVPCKDEGFCTADWNQDYSWCSYNSDRSRWTCVANSEEDCRLSRGCITGGRCKVENDRCVEPIDSKAALRSKAGACQATVSCTRLGQCTPGPTSHECVVAFDADCEQSLLCTQMQRCVARDGACHAE